MPESQPDAPAAVVAARPVHEAPPVARVPFMYAIIRIVPHVERGECMNAGVVLFCRERRFLDARIGLNAARLAAFAPDCDPEVVRPQLEAIHRVAAGDPSAGPIAALSKAERFHWLSSPSSTIVQRSEVHTGLTDDPGSTLEQLFAKLVPL